MKKFFYVQYVRFLWWFRKRILRKKFNTAFSDFVITIKESK